jgi:hypothetical protein
MMMDDFLEVFLLSALLAFAFTELMALRTVDDLSVIAVLLDPLIKFVGVYSSE